MHLPRRLLLLGFVALTATWLAAAPRQQAGRKFMPEGQFVWHEIVAADPEATARFYASTFDWKILRGPVASPDEQPYLMLSHNGQPFAGVTAAEGRARWTSWVQVIDADLAADQALAAGGLVAQPPREHLIGRRVEVVDPGQARLTLVQLHIRQPYVVLPPVRWHLGESLARDGVDDFYREVAGWAVERAGPEAAAEIVVAGHAIAGLRALPVDGDAVAGWLPCFEVDDVRRAVARAVAAGARQLAHPTEREGLGQSARLADPEGVEFWLIAR